MSTATNLNELLDQILEKSRDVMDCEICSILLPQGPDESLVIRSTIDATKTKPLIVPKGRGIAGEVFASKESVNIVDAENDPRHFTPSPYTTTLVTRAMLTIPLLEADRCLGVMQAINPNTEPFFGANDEEIFSTFGSLIAVTLLRLGAQKRAIQEAEMRRELSLANEIQDSFLPAPEVRHGDISVKTFYQPASEIGGDFYFWHALDDNKILLGIGDVCGKGLPAALDMARGTTLIASMAYLSPTMGLGEWFSAVNTKLCEVMSAGRFIAVTALLIDTEKGTVKICEAGLPTPKIFNGSAWEDLNAPGNPPLGISCLISYRDEERLLSTARKWLIFSDGILEVQNPAGEYFEDSAFDAALEKLAKYGNHAVLRNLSTEWKTFATCASYQDDTTVMVITNLGIPPKSEFCFDCQPEATRHGRDFIESWTDYCRLDKEAAGLVILGCDEVFTNLIKHAYCNLDGGAPTTLRAANMDGALRIVIEHRGEGITNEEFQELMKPPSAGERIGGLGMYVIKEVFDTIDFRRDADTSTITLIKNVG
tara:strand:- start:91 stop:1707 length:1617 start_codon:yes stop_codon:yes gene_type:complete